MRTTLPRWSLTALAIAAVAAHAQPQQVRPPQAQAWIDVATFSGFGMPGMTGGPGGPGGNPMAALGGMFGGGGQSRNAFGHTQTGQPGRWVDVTLSSRTTPSLAEAEQAVPPGFLDAPLKLQSPKEARTPPPDDDSVQPATYERPRGKLLLYWGCGPTVRPGQPKVVDLASASASEMAQFFQARRATQRGTHAAAGRPDWPSPADARMVPGNASLVGTHAFSAPLMFSVLRF
jgi:hypothetical protein